MKGRQASGNGPEKPAVLKGADGGPSAGGAVVPLSLAVCGGALIYHEKINYLKLESAADAF